MKRSSRLIILFLLTNLWLTAQNELPVPRNLQTAYDKNTRRPTNTFQFEAKNVTDFVFATADHYMWQSTLGGQKCNRSSILQDAKVSGYYLVHLHLIEVSTP